MIIYPAWFDLYSDDLVVGHPTALRVYARLIRDYPRIFAEPRDVKAWLLATQVHARRESVADALELLIRRGFAIEHGRGLNNVRRLRLATERRLPLKPDSVAPLASCGGT